MEEMTIRDLIKKIYLKIGVAIDNDHFYEKLSDRLGCTTRCFGSRERVHLGNNTSLVNTLFNTASGEIFVGDYTFAGHNVSIITGSHDIYKTRADRMFSIANNNDIVIGKGVWLCSNSCILGPCIIDDDAVVAAGAVVLPNTHIERGDVYGGVPARKISSIYEA